MNFVKFKYPEEACVYPKLVSAVNKLCAAKGKDAICTSGYRSLERQKIINQQTASIPGRTQRPDGSVYDKFGKCWAAAYGKSNHNYCIAMDIDDDWFKKLTNSDLYKYGLFKPMAHEPWHVQLLEHSSLSQQHKEVIRDACVKGVSKEMDIKDFQVIAGLQPDGVSGQKTQAAAKEMMQVCSEILDYDCKTPEEVILATQGSPNIWIGLLKTVKFFDKFVMNIYNKLTGRI